MVGIEVRFPGGAGPFRVKAQHDRAPVRASSHPAESKLRTNWRA